MTNQVVVVTPPAHYARQPSASPMKTKTWFSKATYKSLGFYLSSFLVALKRLGADEKRLWIADSHLHKYLESTHVTKIKEKAERLAAKGYIKVRRQEYGGYYELTPDGLDLFI